MKINKKYSILSLLVFVSGFNIIYSLEKNQTEDTERGYFNTNTSGETYGTHISDEKGLTIKEPDLIEVIGENGVDGYVKKVDLYDETFNPKTPEEFIKYVEVREKNGPRVIPIYEKNGKTIIGEYIID